MKKDSRKWKEEMFEEGREEDIAVRKDGRKEGRKGERNDEMMNDALAICVVRCVSIPRAQSVNDAQRIEGMKGGRKEARKEGRKEGRKE